MISIAPLLLIVHALILSSYASLCDPTSKDLLNFSSHHCSPPPLLTEKSLLSTLKTKKICSSTHGAFSNSPNPSQIPIIPSPNSELETWRRWERYPSRKDWTLERSCWNFINSIILPIRWSWLSLVEVRPLTNRNFQSCYYFVFDSLHDIRWNV